MPPLSLLSPVHSIPGDRFSDSVVVMPAHYNTSILQRRHIRSCLVERILGHAIESKSGIVRIAAVGDILLSPPANGVAYQRQKRLVSDRVSAVFDECDLVFGNLECTLASGESQIPTEPRVFTDAAWIRAVKSSRFGLVTLANNHTFDGLEEGYTELKGVLEEIDLPHFGAGRNLEQAAAPSTVDCNGLRIGFLGAVDASSGPYRFASADFWGVPALDIDRLGSQIRELKSSVDHVVVSVHWGEERFLVPSPKQLEQARALVDGGASMILGHHPHVMQGMEIYRGAPIAYSLGNFLADDVYFSGGGAIRWKKIERTGCLLITELTRDTVRVVRQIPTYDDGQVVAIDTSGFGEGQIRRTNRMLQGGVSASRYRWEHFRVKTLRPTIDHLRPSQLVHLRPRHIRNALRTLWK